MNDNSLRVIEVDINEILPNRFQPRIQFDEDEILELSDSIKEHGVIQPLVVRTIGDKYEIIAGERRYKASVLAGKETVPVIIKNLNDKESAEIALIENIQRKNLTAIEEALSYKNILGMGYLTQESLAKKIGKSQSSIANKIRLLNLSDEVQEALLENKISERHARSLLKISNLEQQNKMLDRIIKERMTVRKTDEEITKMLYSDDSDDNSESNNESTKIIKRRNVEENMNNEMNVNMFSGAQQNNQEQGNGMFGLNAQTAPVAPSFNSFGAGPQEAPAAPSFNSFGAVPQEAPTAPSFNSFGAGPQEAPTAPSFNSFGAVPQEAPAAPSFNSFGAGPQEAPTAPSFNSFGAGPQETPAAPSFNSFGAGPQETPAAPSFNSFESGPQETPSSPSFNSFGAGPQEASDTQNSNTFGISSESLEAAQTPNFESFGLPTSNETVSSPNFNAFSDYSQNESNTNQSVPLTAPIQEFNSNENNANTVSEPIIVTDYSKQYDPVMPQQSNVSPSKANFKEVINAIRDCSKKIEQYGYKIDLEEYDLSNIYQVVFRIDK